MKNTQGFTLIELLIVIAIIGILAAVLIPNLLNAKSAANTSATTSYVRNTMTSIEALKANNNGGFGADTTIANGKPCGGVTGNNPMPAGSIKSCVLTMPSASSPTDPTSFDITAISVNGKTVTFDGKVVKSS